MKQEKQITSSCSYSWVFHLVSLAFWHIVFYFLQYGFLIVSFFVVQFLINHLFDISNYISLFTAQSTARSVLRPNNIQDNSPMNNWPTATERQETIDRIDNGYDGYEDEIPLNANGWSLPKYPVNMMYDLGRPNNLVPTR